MAAELQSMEAKHTAQALAEQHIDGQRSHKLLAEKAPRWGFFLKRLKLLLIPLSSNTAVEDVKKPPASPCVQLPARDGLSMRFE